jgi:putative transposase
MPSRNSLKTPISENYYHIYNRGANKCDIFLDDEDKNKFLSLFARYIDSDNIEKRTNGEVYKKLSPDIELICYCLMTNHFHILVYIAGEPVALRKFMSGLMTSYSMYFNSKYKHSGTLFQGVYKASNVDEDNYLDHITRYIHKNPSHYREYKYSSYTYYVSHASPSWLKTSRMMQRFKTTKIYEEFVAENIDSEKLEDLKRKLADY